MMPQMGSAQKKGSRIRAGRAWLAFLFILFSVPLYSADQNQPDEANSPTPPPIGQKKKPKFHRSRLTSDESEYNADHRRLLLTTGEDKAVDLEFEVANHDAISIGNPKVVATSLAKLGEKRQIVFKPLGAGETTVSVRDPDGTLRVIFNVRVTGSNLLTVAAELRDLLRDIEGIDIRIVGPKVVIDGELLVPADYGRLVSVLSDKAYLDYVLNLTTLSPLAMQVLSRRIQEDIRAFAPNVTTRVVNGFIFLEGTVEGDDQRDRAGKVASLYLPDIRPASQLEKATNAKEPEATKINPPRSLVENFILVNRPPQKKETKLVRITVHFVQLAKDYNKLFGFQWQPGFTPGSDQINIGTTATGGAGGTNGGASFAATISNLFPKLNSYQTAGYARILKTATVIVRSGQPATLSEQTQFPFAQQGPNGQVVAGQQPVGLELGATPTILGQSDDISMDLKMNQISLVGRAPAGGQAPTVANHKVETKVYIKSNESAAIAGVTSSDIGTDFNKDPVNPGTFDNGTDPLFSLLRSKAYRKQKSQFVIFVTPQIIDNASEGTEDLKKNFRIKVK